MSTLSNYYSSIPLTVIDSTYTPSAIFSPVTVDLNGDGNQDLIQLGACYPGSNSGPVSQQARVFFGDGNGKFTEVSQAIFPWNSLLTVHPRKVVTADFNGDGRLDVFIASHGWDTNPFPGEQNRLYLSQQDGTWKDVTSTLPQLNDFSHTAAIGDVNKDGKIDIFVGNGYAGQNQILPYMLMNSGNGQFTQTQTNIPTGANSILDFNTSHHFSGATLSDLNGDGYPELMITADDSSAYDKNIQSAILWNNGGSYSLPNLTLLPASSSLSNHIDLDVKSADINGDGNLDLIIAGTQGQPFYDGWFVQILLNTGGRNYVDATSSLMAGANISSENYGTAKGAPWAMWVTVLDFNHDGFQDFSVEYGGSNLAQSTPLIWLNDGTGHFSTLKVSDFVAPGAEWQLGQGHLVETRNGYSFIETQSYNGSGGLLEVGLLETKPYLDTPPALGPLVGTTGNDILRGSTTNDSLDGGAGIDKVVYLGNRVNYTLSKMTAGWTVSSSAEGVDTLSNIERLKFADKTIALDINSNAGQVYRIYQAAFNRTPDKGGLGDWIYGMDTGMSLLDVSAGFVSSPEFKTVYGQNPTDSEVVTRFYQNVLHRAPEQAGYDYWMNQLQSGLQTRTAVLTGFSESPENQTQVIGVIQNGMEYTQHTV